MGKSLQVMIAKKGVSFGSKEASIHGGRREGAKKIQQLVFHKSCDGLGFPCPQVEDSP